MASMSEDPVKELCDALHDESDQTKAEALMQLAQLLDGTPEGKATVALCGAIRMRGAIEQLCYLIDHPEPIIHQTALMLLANFTTYEVDTNAESTKKIIANADGFSKIANHLFSAVALTVAYACGTIQNTCTDPEAALQLRQSDGIERLRELAKCDVPVIVESAKACLHNLLEASDAAGKTMLVTRVVIRMQRARRKRVRRSPVRRPLPLPPPALPF